MAHVISKDGRGELARLERTEPLGSLDRWLVKPYRPEPDDHVASDARRREAEGDGFRFVGCFSFAGTFGQRIKREMWIDPTNVVKLSMRSESGGVTNAMLSAYSLSTVFDDGDSIVTWSKTPAPVPSNARATSLDGTGDLAADYAKHLAAVQRRAVEHAALTMDDLDVALAIDRWEDTRLYAVGRTRLTTYLMLPIFPAVIVLALLARAHSLPRWVLRDSFYALFVLIMGLQLWSRSRK